MVVRGVDSLSLNPQWYSELPQATLVEIVSLLCLRYQYQSLQMQPSRLIHRPPQQPSVLNQTVFAVTFPSFAVPSEIQLVIFLTKAALIETDFLFLRMVLL